MGAWFITGAPRGFGALITQEALTRINIQKHEIEKSRGKSPGFFFIPYRQVIRTSRRYRP